MVSLRTGLLPVGLAASKLRPLHGFLPHANILLPWYFKTHICRYVMLTTEYIYIYLFFFLDVLFYVNSTITISTYFSCANHPHKNIDERGLFGIYGQTTNMIRLNSLPTLSHPPSCRLLPSPEPDDWSCGDPSGPRRRTVRQLPRL